MNNHPPHSGRPPNILFVLPDQHRGDWLGANPALPLRTPNLDRLAARGVSFTRAFTPAPLCSPARACLATGLEYDRCGVAGNNANTPLALPNYYRRLRAAGYEVAGVGKFDLHKADHDWGADGTRLLPEYGFTRGCDNEGKGDAILTYVADGHKPRGPYMHYLHEHGLAERHFAMYEPYYGKPGWLFFSAVTGLPDEAYCDNWVAANALRQLQEFPAAQPWHLVVNFVGPHAPFDVTAAMHDRWANVTFPPPVNQSRLAPPAMLEQQQHYAAMIENIDTHLGRMLDVVAARGELDHTLVVYSSDHGEMLGEHNLWGKLVWRHPSIHVPLIIAGPGIRAGVRTDALALLHDLAATFLDFAGAEPLPDADARSLRPLLTGGSPVHRPFVCAGMNPWRLIFDGRHKLVVGATPTPLLFDLDADPHEQHNLADTRAAIRAELEQILRACGCAQPPREPIRE